MSKQLVPEEVIAIRKANEKEIVDWYKKTMGCFLSMEEDYEEAEDYHERIVDSMKDHPTFLKSQHLSKERIGNQLSRQFSLITTTPEWIENFASSYKRKLFARIEKTINLDNVNQFNTLVMEIHSNLIDEEIKVHSYCAEPKESLKKSLLEKSVKETLNSVYELNVALYGDELESECSTFSVEIFASKFYGIEHKGRIRFLQHYDTTIDGFLTCAENVMNIIAIKFSISLLLRVFSREMACRMKDGPLTESYFDFSAKNIKLKCVNEFRKVLRLYMTELRETQISKLSERLIEPLLQKIKICKDNNRKLYVKKYDDILYYTDNCKYSY